MNKRIIILLILAAAVFGLFAFFRYSANGTELLWQISNQGKWLLPLIVVSSLIDSINPCAFSILLLTIAFLFSIGQVRSNIVRIGSAYIGGLFLVYLLIGFGLLQVLHLFNTPHFMAKVGAVMLLVLGSINIINELFPAFPIKIRIPQGAHRAMANLMDKGSMPTAFVLGGLVGLCEFPCTGGPYLTVVGLLHDQSTRFAGAGYLILYNLIFILPLAIILGLASDHGLLFKVNGWQKNNRFIMKVGSGIAMIILALLIYYV